MTYKYTLLLLHTSGRGGQIYYGFRMIDNETGAMSEASCGCASENNIINALTYSNQSGWQRNVLRINKPTRERELFKLDGIGSSREAIRKHCADAGIVLPE